VVDGFNYHQQMLKEDASLVEWVLRETYIGHGELPFSSLTTGMDRECLSRNALLLCSRKDNP
jgi:hypothetical protein